MQHKPTLADILEIQSGQVDRWCKVLNQATQTILRAKVVEENKKLTPESDPYSVFRGDSLTTFIQNLNPQRVVIR